MARTQYSVEFKLRVVREAEEVGNAAEVARRYELHPNVVYRWLGAYRRDGEAAFGRKIRRASHGVPVDTARMREVESENERLKRILVPRASAYNVADGRQKSSRWAVMSVACSLASLSISF